MLLQALLKYAQERRLIDNLPFQRRTIHLLVPLRADGALRGEGVVALTTTVEKGNRTKEEVGRELILPRFPGEKNQGKASYLADPFNVVLGLDKVSGVALSIEDKGPERDAVRAHRMFWKLVEEAHGRLGDGRLSAILAFRKKYLPEQNGVIVPQFKFLEQRENPRAKKPKLELMARTENGQWLPLSQTNTVGFEVDGCILAVGDHADPLWQDWSQEFRRCAFTDVTEGDDKLLMQPTLCLVTGEVGQPLARSHKPEIKGIPGLPPKGASFFSCSRDSPAFSSYGFKMGENAPVSEHAAASYALALNELLASDDTYFRVGEVAFCFWSEWKPNLTAVKFKLITTANPKLVGDFLKGPFAGIDRELAKQEQFLSVALSANAGRVVVRAWLRLPLELAINNLQQWFVDLKLVTLGGNATEKSGDEEKVGPYSLFRLAAALVRDSKELKRMSEAVAELYRAALELLTPPVGLLEPILAEFRSALVSDTTKKPRYPLTNLSRFALIKLILTRIERQRQKHQNDKGGFMPNVHLATNSQDQAYNLGRLLTLLARLQNQAHDGKLEGPGVVQRYYAAASSAPATVFGILEKLHHHHLRKLEQQPKNGKRKAESIKGRIGSITARFPPDTDGTPRFPAQLSLEEQGRFALGFYQQEAYERTAAKVWKLLKDAKAKSAQEAESLLRQAQRIVKENDYPDLVEAVEQYSK